MYSGFLTPRHSNQWLGTHQKFNRVSHRLVLDTVKHSSFPSLNLIQGFEGLNGPDGIKLKSPSQNEPWHYYDPLDDEDTQLIELLDQHYINLVKALAEKNMERSAFEASWLAHGITDGLTPAHQYPYEKELEDITGKHKDARTTRTKKIIASGNTKPQFVKNNWRLWGLKGLMLTHHGFEIGVATIAIPMRIHKFSLTDAEIKQARKLGHTELFKSAAKKIASYHMYDRFYRAGWNTALGRDVREVLVPTTTKTVALAWLLAFEEATKKK